MNKEFLSNPQNKVLIRAFIFMAMSEKLWTKKELYENTRLSSRTLSRHLEGDINNNETTMTVSTYYKIIDVLGKTHQDVLDFIEKKKRLQNDTLQSDKSQDDKFLPKRKSTHESVMRAFYFPIQLGKLIKHTHRVHGPQDRDSNPLEGPLGWKEGTEHVSQKHFEREAPEQVLEHWLNETEGVFLILGQPGGGKTTLLQQWEKQLESLSAVKYIALRQFGCVINLTSDTK